MWIIPVFALRAYTFRIETRRARPVRAVVSPRRRAAHSHTSFHMRLLLRHARRQRGEKIVDSKIIRAPCRPGARRPTRKAAQACADDSLSRSASQLETVSSMESTGRGRRRRRDVRRFDETVRAQVEATRVRSATTRNLYRHVPLDCKESRHGYLNIILSL